MKQIILDTASDLMANFLYYDRKEDEDLPIGVIEQTIRDGEITVDEIVSIFRQGIEESIEIRPSN